MTYRSCHNQKTSCYGYPASCDTGFKMLTGQLLVSRFQSFRQLPS